VNYFTNLGIQCHLLKKKNITNLISLYLGSVSVIYQKIKVSEFLPYIQNFHEIQPIKNCSQFINRRSIKKMQDVGH
jgi:hypothetical protein